MERTLRLNIVTKEESRVIAELSSVSTKYIATLANRVSNEIVEIDLTCTEPTAISLENIKEILYWIPAYDIRFIIG